MTYPKGPHVQIFVGASLQDKPPGTYSIKLHNAPRSPRFGIPRLRAELDEDDGNFKAKLIEVKGPHPFTMAKRIYPVSTIPTTPNELIALLFEAITHGTADHFPNRKKDPHLLLRTPAEDQIDHTRFNRAEVNYNGMDVTISIFSTYSEGGEQHETHKEDVARQEGLELSGHRSSEVRGHTKEEAARGGKLGADRAFIRDHRDNPKLHALYVAYAIEELELAQRHREEWNEFSRTSASAIGHALWKQIQQEILEDAAWFEAAAIVFTGEDTRPYLEVLDRGKDEVS